ncbi:MAG TPA: 3-hydroxyacyl-CoA dehydrogenase NAD-binding domain-containing protein, partial [Tepidisphaeraceae bacterium]|nr:3-hydroxyacyl-CoA dehydrogenase NAD-binding domain-containing protein [Tepidisphaeraceae bacterium]
MDNAVHISTDADRVMTVTMDLPGKPVNTCSSQMLDELSQAIDKIERERPAGVIFASAKARSFNAGADLFDIRKMSRDQTAEYLKRGQSLFARIASLPVPTIAAINGDTLGGGCELALACTYRVAVDDTSISIGLPEVKLGLIPAWGGTTRLPRLIGLRNALPILLAGKTMPPRKAQRAGLVDEVVRREALLAAAKRIVLSKHAPHRPARLDRAADKLAVARNRMIDTGRRKTMAMTYGNYPAPLSLLDVLRAGYERGLDAGLEAERQAIIDLTATDTGRNLLRVFFLRQGAKKAATGCLTGGVAATPASPVAAAGTQASQLQEQQSTGPEVRYAAVIGGGTMGAGIVHALIRAGIPVRLVEVNPQAVSAALGRIKKMLDDDVAMGKLDKLAARHTFNRVSPTTDWTGLELADFVVEAVLETIEAKREVFSKLDRLCRPTAVLATNTSSLRLADIEQATLHPERIVGLHFFNPVPKMPLVEVVRGPHSDDASLATAIALAGRMGKTPVLVNDAPGFLVNRILVPYLAEALLMASEGRSILSIDDAMKRWGMPMGPFELLDEIGLDIAAHVLKSLGGVSPPPAKVVAAIGQAQQRKWLGKKTGRGFYVHRDKRGAKPVLNEELGAMLAPTAAGPLSPDESLRESIQWRLVLPMVNEAARAIEEGVTDSTDTIDLAMVMGTGFAPFRGGLMQFANTTGAEEIVRRMDELAGKRGARFEPAKLLREAARERRTIGASPPTAIETTV